MNNKFTMLELPYSYEDMEPYIDATTMEVHYSGHYRAYTNKLNDAIEKHPELFEKSIEDILSNLNLIPDDIRDSIINNGGGYYNHTFFWNIMSPNGGELQDGDLANSIINRFGSIENFKNKFSDSAKTLFGSGWTWLVYDAKTQKLDILNTKNQDCPPSIGLSPIIGLDVWEHAYYLKYRNKRADYVDSWWNIVNWDEAIRIFDELKS